MKNKFLLILLILASLCLCFSLGKITNIFIDVGREIYYPLEILNGKILYKDLFCIYGPASYLFNAILYKIFGIKLTSLYIGGITSALLIVVLIYKISKKFLNETISFSITLFVILTGCLAVRIFNYTLPYSYAALYGMVCFLISILFLINFIEDNKIKNLIIASIFAGFAISNKYDFILYFIPLSIVILKTKNLKLILNSYLAFLTPIILPFLLLFIQGLDLKSLFHAGYAIQKFMNTESLRIFYTTQGVYYTNKVWQAWGMSLFYHSLIFGLIYFGLFLLEKKHKIFGIILIFFSILIVSFFAKVESYLFLTFLTFILFIFCFNKNTFAKNIFILSALLVSLKSLWGLAHVNYGIYYTGIIFISFFILIAQLFNKKGVFAINLILIGLIINYGFSNIISVLSVNYKIKTDKGILYTFDDWGKATNELISYINNIKEENPKIVIYPEGLSINFLTSKKNTIESFYNSLIPLYVESFGEDEIISNIKKSKPDYIIFSNFPSSSYNKGSICTTYAFDICSFVNKNYIPIKKIEEKDKIYIIFKSNLW